MEQQGRVYAAAAAWAQRHRLLLDSVFAGMVLLFCWLALAYEPGLFAITTLQIAPLAVRRVAPVLATLLVTVGCLLQVWLLDIPLASNIAVPIVVYTVASLSTNGWQRFGVLALALSGAAIATARWSEAWSGIGERTPAQVLTLALVLALVVVPAWVLGDAVRNRRIVMARLREQNEALARDQGQRAALAAQAERAGIAREMHDIVAHSLAVVVVQADGAAYATRAALAASADRVPVAHESPVGSGAGGPEPDVGARALAERAASTLETVADTARGALADTRRLVGVLREGQDPGAEYAPTDGLRGLDTLVERVRSSGVEVALQLTGAVDGVPRDVDLAAYRIVQESLTNVLKHAGPGVRAHVRVRVGEGLLEIDVGDDGHGQGAVGDGHGNGILGMRERVGVFGGTLYAGPRLPRGFGVQATIPFRIDPVPPPGPPPTS